MGNGIIRLKMVFFEYFSESPVLTLPKIRDFDPSHKEG
jgi:hypothetical protein